MRPAGERLGEPIGSLFRAVGLNEAVDLKGFGGFRPHPSGLSLEDKWFAASLADAVAFGRLMQRNLPDPRPFIVAVIELPAITLSSFYHHPRLDGIGPAYLVRMDQLPDLNARSRITIGEWVYEVET